MTASTSAAILPPTSRTHLYQDSSSLETRCPSSSWIKYQDDSCLLFHSFDVDYQKGEEGCRSLGGKLVSVKTREEEDAVLRLLLEKRDSLLKQSKASLPFNSSFRNTVTRKVPVFFWLDARDVNRREALETVEDPLPPKGCPHKPTGCPAKVVRSMTEHLWCYFDCRKSSVHAICQVKATVVTATTEPVIVKEIIEDKKLKEMNALKGEVSSSPQESLKNHPDLDSLSSPSMTDNETINDVRSNKDVKHKTFSNDDTEDDQLRDLMMTSSTITVTSSDEVSSPFMESFDDASEATTIIINKKRDIVSSKPSARYRALSNTSYNCEVGWRLQDRKCYKILPSMSSGEEASSACLLLYAAQAAIITSRAQSDMLVAMINANRESIQSNVIILNGKRIGLGERFSWSNNEVFDFKNWAAGEPQNYKNGDCVGAITMSSTIGQWKTVSCMLPANVLCSKNAKETILFDANQVEEVIEEPSTTMSPIQTEKEEDDDDEKNKSSDQLHLERDPEDESVLEKDHGNSESENTHQPKTNTTTSLTLCLLIVAVIAVMILLCFVLGLKKRKKRRASRNRRSSKESSGSADKVNNGNNNGKRTSSKEGPIFLDNNKNSSQVTEKKDEAALLPQQ
jgi:Tfp pilus assembly major pilin PilA